jgi:hypothetical protein
MDETVVLEVKNSRDSEEPIAAMEQVFAAIGTTHHRSLFARMFGPKPLSRWFSFEIVAAQNSIHFLISTPQHLSSAIESQLTAQYPKLSVTPVSDYVQGWMSLPHLVRQLTLTAPYYVPIKVFKDVRDLDLLASVIGQMAKLTPEEAVGIQIRVAPAGASWQHSAHSVITHGIPDPSFPGRTKAHPQAKLIETKLAQVGYTTSVRLCAVGKTTDDAERVIHAIAGTFGVFSSGDGNGLALADPPFWETKALERSFAERSSETTPRYQVLGSAELAGLWHPPGLLLSAIRSIAWGGKLTGEPPENLPVATENEEEKKEINFFARTEFKNKMTTFGIKRADRRKHTYIMGKTGSGKSTLIANMVINDMRNGEGMCIIDPHGDLIDLLMDYIPSYRINDVAYLDPSDTEYPFHLNPLEVKNDALKELIASGIVSIFHKLYHYSWGPRLEYILRNTILTLLQVPNSTFLEVPELLTNDRYRDRIIEKLEDGVLKSFWVNEFNKLTPQMRSESIMPILNKVGQFLSSKTIRNIIGNPTSTIDFEDMMNQGKIILVNLSQGKLGEDSSALLGAMMITKLQLAAMNRVYIAEDDRRDFFLYVDEFQNFATNSFVKILSEARKYRLNLTLANQYIGQIEEEVQNAIFGNTGSLLAFGVGATDARPLSREFGLKYKEEELVQLGNYQIVLKLSIDNHTSSPFAATTLPLPRSINQNRDKIIRSSRERFARHVEPKPVVPTPQPHVPPQIKSKPH